MSTQSRHVAIIGAGAGGISAARHLLEAGHEVTVFEQGSHIGGLWVYDNDNDLSVAYASLHINSEPEATAFRGYPFRPGTPLFPSHREIAEYLNEFADEFDLCRRIRFHTRVLDVEPADLRGGRGWALTLDGGEIESCDDVVVASGHQGIPAHPDWWSKFSGQYLHSHAYREPQAFAGKRVLVVGVGNSGLDIAADLVPFAEQVYSSARSPVLIMPRMMFGVPTARVMAKLVKPWMPWLVQRQIMRALSRVYYGRMEDWGLRTPGKRTHPASNATYMSHVAYNKIMIEPGIRAVKDSTITFENGESIEVDTVIAATGYLLDIPFLKGDLAPLNGRRLEAYRRVAHPDWPGLYFIGFFNVSGGANISMMDVQSQFLTAVVSGQRRLPSAAGDESGHRARIRPHGSAVSGFRALRPRARSAPLSQPGHGGSERKVVKTSLHRVAAIAGVGETCYERVSAKSASRLQFEASLTAIADAGLEPKDIDGVIPIGITGAPAEDYIANLGIDDLRFSALIPHGGASGIGALQCAAAAIAAGICTTVLVPSGRNVSSGDRAGVRIHQMPQFHFVSDFERSIGAIAPAQLYAPMARKHMTTYGTTSEQLGEIAVTTRRHAMLNDNAIMQKPMTMADHQASRMITDPFRLFDCSLESDGGAAFIVTSTERARGLPQPRVDLLGVAMGHPDSPSSITQRPDITKVGVAKAAGIAFQTAGVSHDDIDVAEIYDCFTWVVLCQLEDLGFCKKGEGGSFVSGGRLAINGVLPTNTHGGLLSQAHMLGMNHIVELVRQLRGQGDRRQVADAQVGLVTGYGDQGDGGVAIMAAGR